MASSARATVATCHAAIFATRLAGLTARGASDAAGRIGTAAAFGAAGAGVGVEGSAGGVGVANSTEGQGDKGDGAIEQTHRKKLHVERL
jgi:hypothetical protein